MPSTRTALAGIRRDYTISPGKPLTERQRLKAEQLDEAGVLGCEVLASQHIQLIGSNRAMTVQEMVGRYGYQ